VREDEVKDKNHYLMTLNKREDTEIFGDGYHNIGGNWCLNF
jgi:hypothetical protein